MAGTVDYVPGCAATASRDAAAAYPRWRKALLALIGIEAVVLFAPTVLWLVDRWTMSVWHNAHGIFVVPLAAWLAWQELDDSRTLPVDASRWGFVLLVPALALHALDAGMHTQLLSALALFTAIGGLSLLLLGRARTRRIAFPLAFLAFAVPIPLAFTEPVHAALRQFVATTTASALPMFGVSVFREGTALHTTNGTIRIVDACSGFSTLYASAAVAALVAYTARSRPRRALVLLAAAPIAIAANVVRVVALSLLVFWYGAGVLDTYIHPLSGMATFAIAIPLIFWIGGPARGRQR